MPPDDDAPQVFVEEQPYLPPKIEAAETSRTVIAGTAMGRAVGQIAEFTSIGEAEAHPHFSDYGQTIALTLRLFFENGGKHVAVLGLAGLADPRGLDPLGQRNFNLLCIPTVSSDPDVSLELHAAAYSLCGVQRAIYLVDPPASWSSSSDPVRAAIDGARRLFAEGKNAALYFPRVNLADGTESFSPSGAIAGFIARSDQTRGVWKGPAGVEASLRGVVSLASPLHDHQRGALNSAGINALHTLPRSGPVIWGARTLAGWDDAASDWKYLPVRRLALFIESSLASGLSWTVFEPNDERLWARVRDTVRNFLFDLWRQGAFMGRRPEEGLFVNCGELTMTADDIQNGRLICEIGFAPLKPAEFVIIRIFARTAV
jgi:uncharacterized protein